MAMKKESFLKLNSIILTISIFITGCGEINCPSFPNENINWFPYSTGDTIVLCNDSNSTISLPITQFHITDSYSFSKQCDCICEASLSFETSIDTINLISLESSIIYVDGVNINQPLPVEVRIGIYNKEEELFIPLQHDEFYCNESSNWELQDSVMIYGKYFKNVLTISNSDNSKFQEITLVKGIGIMKITDKESNVWKLNLE